MISFTSIAMIGWLPVILLLFAVLRPRRAVIVAYIVGWMFLPVISWDIPGLPPYDKLTATNLGVIGAILLFDIKTLLRFRPTAVDLPLVVLCLCPIASSLVNGLGLYDGVSGAFRQVAAWSVPWLVGRCYLTSLPALKELAAAMLVASALYVPLCLFEMVFGATLHSRLYGYFQHGVDQTIRSDGSVRPMVFMHHGLMLSMWLASSSLVGLAVAWHRNGGRARRRLNFWMAASVLVTCVLSRSLGATALMVVGIAVWVCATRLRTSLPLLALVVAAPIYMTARATNLLTSSELTGSIALALETAGVSEAETAARIRSAATRFTAEDQLCAEVRQDPLFGVNSWTFHLFVDPETGETRTVLLDGLWAILLATRGVIGLAAWAALLLVPVLLFIARHPVRTWRDPNIAIGGALAIILLMHTLDCLLNSDTTPLYTCIAGGVASLPALPLRRGRSSARGPTRALVAKPVS